MSGSCPRRVRFAVVLLPALVCSLRGPVPTGRAQTDTGPRKDRHALLIGVTYYENLPKAKHLAGPGNDVLLMRQVLLDKFHFDPQQIVVLSEQQGKDRGKDFYPTRTNIERAFQRLAEVVRPGDQVVIHMGGHGSQQPENRNASEPEPDGLDEIFLPRDVGVWDGRKGTVVNAIIDDDMARWLKAIRDARASVWITFDSCHSGTMIRGGDDNEKPRDLDPVEDLGIPRATIQEAVKFAAAREPKERSVSPGGETAAPFKLAREGNIVAIYACQPNEVTYERQLPAAGGNGKVQGLLTFALCKVLTEAAEKSAEPITYNELARRILAQYVQWGRASPTPLVEGVDRDRQILGDKVWPGRSSILLAANRDGLTLNAGALHGLTAGSILAVLPPPGQGNKVIGHVRVTDVRSLNAEVEPCAYDKTPRVKNLPDGGACKLVFLDVGDQQLRVAVDPRDTANQQVPSETLQSLAKVLLSLKGEQSLIRPIDKAREADWLVRLRGKEVVLVRGAAGSAGRDADNALFGPAAIDDKLGDWLKDSLTRIARAENLKRLAAGSDLDSGDRAVRLDVKVSRRKNAADRVGSIPIEWPAPEIQVYDGDKLVVRFTNKGKVPIDVTLLYVDSGCGIDCFYPRNDELNRLRPGDTGTIRSSIYSNTTGREQMIFIAVKGKGQPVDFSQLTQPTLAQAVTKAGTRGEDLKQALDTSVGRLLKRGMYGAGATRGGTVEEVEDYALLVIPLRVAPRKRPSGP